MSECLCRDVVLGKRQLSRVVAQSTESHVHTGEVQIAHLVCYNGERHTMIFVNSSKAWTPLKVILVCKPSFRSDFDCVSHVSCQACKSRKSPMHNTAISKHEFCLLQDASNHQMANAN